MNRIFALLGVLALSTIVAPSLGHATSAASEETYFVSYHFDGFAFGKPVRSVMVHTGVVQRDYYRDNRPYWSDVKDVAMTRVRDHFIAKAVLKGRGTSSGLIDHGPIVQYWVQFEDGSELRTDPVFIMFPTNVETYPLHYPDAVARYHAALTVAQQWLDNLKDVTQTFAELVKAETTHGF